MASKISSQTDALLDTEILIVGGGPVGMFTAYRLGQLGRSVTLVEKSMHTTVYPKMEYTNHRTMEIYRRVGLKDHLKPYAVPEDYKFAEVFATGFGEKNFTIARIDRPSPAEIRKQSAKLNDGSCPLEPHMRQTQDIYEAILKTLVQKEPLIQDLWGYSFESLNENEDGVLSKVIDSEGKPLVIRSKYVIGCDGAGSKVRLHSDLRSERLSLPMKFVFVHFKSSDREKLQSNGDFWHQVLMNGAAMVAQDEVDTYTVHVICPPDADIEVPADNTEKWLNEILGGWGGLYDIKVDKVIVIGKWQADMSIASSFRSKNGRVFLAGDSAHQLTPAGGHGLNSGIQDAYDLTWKLKAYLEGWGGDTLLQSYNVERRAVAELHVKMVEKATLEVVLPWFSKAAQLGKELLMLPNEDGQRARNEVADAMMKGRWIHEQNGVVLGYRYDGSPVVIPDPSAAEPSSSIAEYTPTTSPGGRAPHVFLSDGKTSILDLYGPGFSIVEFTATGKVADQFVAVATALKIPITKVHLPSESHCRTIWERDVVLVRPDGIVSWRIASDGSELTDDAITAVLHTAVGKGN
ncbi:FAD binding domain-containing protein [Xylogone sp. PMI_703]|nr:FAD binding domain-containing protein [Xylogone sp. PMI_703]